MDRAGHVPDHRSAAGAPDFAHDRTIAALSLLPETDNAWRWLSLVISRRLASRAAASGSPVASCGPDGGHAEADGLPGGADRGHGLPDLRPVGVAEVVQVGSDPADQLPEGDLLVGRGSVGACPGLQVGSGVQAFPVGQQLLEVALQLGQVGRVAAEVPAAGVHVLVGQAWRPALTLERLGAHPERDGDLADAHAGVLVGQQPGDGGEDALPDGVELVRATLPTAARSRSSVIR